MVRDTNDNVINFSVKMPYLNNLAYINGDDDEVRSSGSLTIDCPQLKYLHVADFSEDDCLILDRDYDT